MLVAQKTKRSGTILTTASVVKQDDGMYCVSVIHRFDSGNFLPEEPRNNLSLEAAEGLMHFYTE